MCMCVCVVVVVVEGLLSASKLEAGMQVDLLDVCMWCVVLCGKWRAKGKRGKTLNMISSTG